MTTTIHDFNTKNSRPVEWIMHKTGDPLALWRHLGCHRFQGIWIGDDGYKKEEGKVFWRRKSVLKKKEEQRGTIKFLLSQCKVRIDFDPRDNYRIWGGIQASLVSQVHLVTCKPNPSPPDRLNTSMAQQNNHLYQRTTPSQWRVNGEVIFFPTDTLGNIVK